MMLLRVIGCSYRDTPVAVRERLAFDDGQLLQSLEELEPVLHTREGPLAFRKLGVSPEQAKRLIQELL